MDLDNMDNIFFDIPECFITRYYDDESDGKLPDYRTVFMRDRDRTLYCTAFRRLAGKTQIYTIGGDDHKQNRLTHSLEVAQVARTIARALGLNEYLVESIALGHDLGHTPFGHAGEQMLNNIMIPNADAMKYSPFYHTSAADIFDTVAREQKKRFPKDICNYMYGFKHNIQSVRVVSFLEDSYRDNDGKNIGLNLTNYTLWGMMNHSRILYNDGDAYPNYQNYFANRLKIKDHDTEAWSFEAYVVKQADDIAQWHHDLEDAIRGQAVPIKRICQTIIKALGTRLEAEEKQLLLESAKSPNADRKLLTSISHIVINTLVNDLINFSIKNLLCIQEELQKMCLAREDLAEKLYSEYDNLDLPMQRQNVISFSSKINIALFKELIKGLVHHSRDVERMNAKGQYIIRKLFEAYYSHPQQLPDGPILHFMVEIGTYKNIDYARIPGIGKVRMQFERVMENAPLLYKAILMRRICDHIASMTDHYAIEEYKNLYG